MKKCGVLLMLCCTAYSLASELLTKAAFTEQYIAVARQAYPNVTFTITGELSVSVKHKEGGEGTTYLDNAYLNYTGAPENLDEILTQYTASLDTLLQSENQPKSIATIFPVIKDNLYLQEVTAILKAQQDNNNDTNLYYEPLNDQLVVMYAFDTPTSLQFVTTKDVHELKINTRELREIAKANLQQAVPLTIEGDPSWLSMLVADGSYEASFILFDDIWTRDYFPVKGDIVIFVPSRDLVLITGSEDLQGLARIHQIINDPQNTFPHMVSEQGFIRKNNRWERLD